MMRCKALMHAPGAIGENEGMHQYQDNNGERMQGCNPI